MKGDGRNTQTVWKDQKLLRTGYTTGSCAAAAAKASAFMLLSKEPVYQVSLKTPQGAVLYLAVECIDMGADRVSCAVRKDSGDDPDVTDGVLVFAEVARRAGTSVSLDGGKGVGRVTKKGLDQPPGAAAINKVPRRMIVEAVEEQRRKFGCTFGLHIIISIPEGEALAEKTFNPRLGIEGGLSVLGTSGIVEPMSERALTDTICLEMKVLKENGHEWCYIVPGNYGSDFLTETLKYDGRLAVKCSNYIGETIDDAVRMGMKGILFVGHIGKLVKIAAGVMNTHSRQADCRMEVFAAHAALAGASRDTVRQLMECVTTAGAVDILKASNMLEPVMQTIMEQIDVHLKQRAGKTLMTGAIVFSAEEGILGQTSRAAEILEQIRKGTV
ncbi:cobalt-precorrin-5B (C(1))-methyltransferase CbiD [[Clostridium] hylemonae]|uniref:Cobalt-precorrin-5B C(1)-methyltransferase n=1 Tax=[Clostridium] hylemonae DSM 15053 TaxID=553973 RepID=C0BZA5_9FIRM|nr:cobalt-precorrin-5B (C(1))-methyltransferase CbiD [[Clostridium] hylemonae]EEG74483.1 cobalamin biosynthesis protein CbiD [[Clostridium] hylemonae DSM 15053]QEK18520.1 Cobalt-precorrin-5B C(1)-methyltransferase [[Clostridium] hylemonae DSM 15053]